MGCSTVQKAILIVTEDSCQVGSPKRKNRIDIKGGGGSALDVNLTFSVDKSIFRRPLNKVITDDTEGSLTESNIQQSQSQYESRLSIKYSYHHLQN